MSADEEMQGHDLGIQVAATTTRRVVLRYMDRYMEVTGEGSVSIDLT